MTEINRNSGAFTPSSINPAGGFDGGLYNDNGIRPGDLGGLGTTNSELLARERLADGFRTTQLGGVSGVGQAGAADFMSPTNAYRGFAFANGPDGSLGMGYGVGPRGGATLSILQQGNNQLNNLNAELDSLLQQAADLEDSGADQMDKNILQIKIQDVMHKKEELTQALTNIVNAISASLNNTVRQIGR